MKKLLGKVNLLMKYNKLKNKIETIQQERDDKIVELSTERRIHRKEKQIWECKLNELEEEIINLKKGKRHVSKSNTESTRVSRKKQNNK